MSTDLELAAMQSIYTTLAAETTFNTYDYVPELPAGMPLDAFPYVVIGLNGSRPYDTDTFVGDEIDVYFHVWSRAEGTNETRTIAARLNEIFHRKPPVVSGANSVDMLRRFAQIYRDPDGKTFHGIFRYRLTLTEEV